MSRSREKGASRGDPVVPPRWLRNSAGGPCDTRDKPPQTVLATCGTPPGSPRDARSSGLATRGGRTSRWCRDPTQKA
jgi:hypothetical protein